MEPFAVVFAREAYARALANTLPIRNTTVASRSELIAAISRHRPQFIYVDVELKNQIDGAIQGIPLIGLVEGGLPGFLRALHQFPDMSHVMNPGMLATSLARPTLARFHERLARGAAFHVLGSEGKGRVALLSSSSRREGRLERLREFFEQHEMGSRTVRSLSDIAEELITNALYDALVEAGYYPRAVSRTTPVDLPPQHACEVSYAFDRGSGFVRIRDPFGAFDRARMFNVLDRCNTAGGNVQLDESRGGAGLGLWRVFTNASMVAITVIPGRLTDMIAWIDPMKKRQLNAISMIFPMIRGDGTLGRFAGDQDHDLMDDSFTALVPP